MVNADTCDELRRIRLELRTDGRGLDETEVTRRLAVYGPNVPRPRRERALALQFLSRFGNPLSPRGCWSSS